MILKSRDKEVKSLQNDIVHMRQFVHHLINHSKSHKSVEHIEKNNVADSTQTETSHDIPTEELSETSVSESSQLPTKEEDLFII